MSILTRLAVTRPLVTALLGLGAMLVGVYAATQLNAELIPEIDFPVVTVVTVYPGASPDDVADQVSEPLEAVVGRTAGLRSMQSTSAADISLIVAEFPYGTDMKKAEADIASNLRGISLPTGVQAPKVARIDPNAFPIVRLSIFGEGTAADLEGLARESLVPSLAAIPGVHTVDLTGGRARRVEVLVDPSKAKEKGVSVQQIAALLQANNLAVPGGNVAIDGESMPLRTLHTFASIADIENTVVGVSGSVGAGALASGAGGPIAAAAAGNPLAAPAAPSAPPPAVAGTTATGQVARYVVQAGDNLSRIAARFDTTAAALAEANRLRNPNLLAVGQTLRVPAPAPRPPTAPPAPQPVQPQASPSVPMTPNAGVPQPVALKDVAEVRLGTGNGAIVRTNGRPSLSIDVTKSQEANTVRVAEAVQATVSAFAETQGDQVQVATVYDGSNAVRHSIDGLLREGVMGSLLAVAVVLLFLASLRGALTVAISIPLSLLVAFGLMWWQGFTLNIMTLGGLAVAIGRVVDDSIVVSESIIRRAHAGEGLATAIHAGTAEVASPITSSTLTTVAVFLPLGLVSGLAGQVFRPFALTVSFALLASLICAVTLIPAVARLAIGKHSETQPEGEGRLASAYGRVLGQALRHRRLTLALAALLFAGSLASAPFIPRSFLPTQEEKLLTINLSAPSGGDSTWLEETVPAVEAVLQNTADVEVYQASIGSRDNLSALSAAIEGRDPNGALFLVRFGRDADLAAKTEELRGALAPVAEDGAVSISQQQSAQNSRLQVSVSGPNANDVAVAAPLVLEAVRSVRGLANVSSDAAVTKKALTVTVDPNKALTQGLTTAQVAMQVRQLFAGQEVTNVRIGGGDPVPVRLGLATGAVSNLEDIGNLPFGGAGAQPLSSIASIEQVERPTRITRIDRHPGISITGDIVALNTGEVADVVQRKIAALSLPNGVSVQYGGAISEMEDSFAQMYFALALAVVAVFAVMAIFFGSALEPLVILASLPLAAIGALLGLLVTGRALGLPAMIGLLMLIGIVVTNAIVLIDLAKRLHDAGEPIGDAVLEAGRIRLRPVLMTALATILALVPLALGINEGAIIAADLATVVIGGLLTSTFLTLVVVPVAYSIVKRPRQA